MFTFFEEAVKFSAEPKYPALKESIDFPSFPSTIVAPVTFAMSTRLSSIASRLAPAGPIIVALNLPELTFSINNEMKSSE